MGYRVFLSEKKIRKSHYYRVRVGRYNSISDADSVIYRLRDEGFSPVLVKFVK
jgi:cell division protein FtsN